MAINLSYKRYVLDNGIRLIVHEYPHTQLAAISLLCAAGSKDENPERTGLAHLMEHLMFAGTKKYPDFDKTISSMGGTMNAYTNADITHYYNVVPSNFTESVLKMEADRFFFSKPDEKSFLVQQQVVAEEFRQRYVNQPFGDLQHLIREQCYKTHPYRWPTIGKNIEQIEKLTLDDVLSFKEQYYSPSNLIISIAGNVNHEEILKMVEKEFNFTQKQSSVNEILKEKQQSERRELTIHRDVPANLLVMNWHMEKRAAPGFYTGDLASDILGNGRSSRLYAELVTQKHLFTEISAAITGSFDPGLFTVKGVLQEGVDPMEAEAEVWAIISKLISGGLKQKELKKVQNKFLTGFILSCQQVLTRALQFALAENEGNADNFPALFKNYRAINEADLINWLSSHITEEKTNVIFYIKK